MMFNGCLIKDERCCSHSSRSRCEREVSYHVTSSRDLQHSHWPMSLYKMFLYDITLNKQDFGTASNGEHLIRVVLIGSGVSNRVSCEVVPFYTS